MSTFPLLPSSMKAKPPAPQYRSNTRNSCSRHKCRGPSCHHTRGAVVYTPTQSSLLRSETNREVETDVQMNIKLLSGHLRYQSPPSSTSTPKYYERLLHNNMLTSADLTRYALPAPRGVVYEPGPAALQGQRWEKAVLWPTAHLAV